MPVEGRIGDPCPEHAAPRPRLQEAVPEPTDGAGIGVELEADLAGVARPADQEGSPGEGVWVEAVVAKGRDGTIEEGLEERRGPRALEIDFGGLLGEVPRLGPGGEVGGDPRVVPPAGGGVDDEQELGPAETVDEQVVQDPALGVAHEAVAATAGPEISERTGQNAVQVGLGRGTFHADLPHVAGIEDHHPFARRPVLAQDALVLDRHGETREGAHPCLQGEMPLVQARDHQPRIHFQGSPLSGFPLPILVPFRGEINLFGSGRGKASACKGPVALRGRVVSLYPSSPRGLHPRPCLDDEAGGLSPGRPWLGREGAGPSRRRVAPSSSSDAPARD